MASRSFFVTLFSIIQLFLSAQDISGVWVGNYKPAFFSATPDKLVVEISIYSDSLISGVSHLYYKHQQYEHYKMKLTSTGNLLQMKGRWEDNSIGMFPCPPSGVWLEKKVDENIKQANAA